MNKQKAIATLTTTRLTLRALRVTDVDNIFTYAQNQELTKYVFWDAHTTKKYN